MSGQVAALQLAKLARLRFARGKALWFCLGAAVLPVVLALAFAVGGKFGGGLVDELAAVFFRLLIPGLPAFLAAAVVADESDRRTFTYLFTRPNPRAAFVAGQFLVIAIAVGGLMLLSVAVTWILCWLRSPGDMISDLGHLLRLECGVLVGTFAFAALGLGLSVLLRTHAFLIITVYLLFDAGIGLVPLSLRYGSLSWHVGNLGGLVAAGLGEGPISPVGSLLVIACLSSLALLIATWRVQQIEP